MPHPPPTSPLLVLEGISKAYPGVQALCDVSLTLSRGEVLALMGENGAGKSTLIKILCGAVQPDAGRMTFDGRPLRPSAPADALRQGIAVIHQELNLVPALSARENLFLGQEPSRLGLLRRRREHAEAVRLLARLGMHFDPELACRRLSVAQQQAVEIARALAQRARILVMDEPTAALTHHEVARLMEIIGDLKRQGIGILYVSHRLEEVFQIADRVLVLRDGRYVDSRPVQAITRGELIEQMVGRAMDQEFPKVAVPPGPPRLEVRGLTRGRRVRDVSLVVHRGEVLGITGLVGAGRTELARLIFGADRADGGQILLDGRRLNLRSPRDAIAEGICLLTEDRKTQGLILKLSCEDNFALPNLVRWSRGGWVRQAGLRRALHQYVRDLRIRLADFRQPAAQLSGGNQQKLVLAKWLQANAEVVLFDEPTRGIDVGAKYEIYQWINRLAAQGKAIVLFSGELPEVLEMSDRVLVMRDGQIVAEVSRPSAARAQEVLAAAMGETASAAGR